MRFPADSVTDRLFKPTSEGGLGVDPETFFRRSFTPRTLDRYPDRDSELPHWCFRVGDPCE